MSKNTIKNIILDFDGTCTKIELAQEGFIETYRKNANKFLSSPQPQGCTTIEISAAQWTDAIEAVRENSPQAGWTVGGAPAAPANADHRTKLSNITYLGFQNFIPEGTTQEVTYNMQGPE